MSVKFFPDVALSYIKTLAYRRFNIGLIILKWKVYLLINLLTWNLHKRENNERERYFKRIYKLIESTLRFGRHTCLLLTAAMGFLSLLDVSCSLDGWCCNSLAEWLLVVKSASWSTASSCSMDGWFWISSAEGLLVVRSAGWSTASSCSTDGRNWNSSAEGLLVVRSAGAGWSTASSCSLDGWCWNSLAEWLMVVRSAGAG